MGNCPQQKERLGDELVICKLFFFSDGLLLDGLEWKSCVSLRFVFRRRKGQQQKVGGRLVPPFRCRFKLAKRGIRLREKHVASRLARQKGFVCAAVLLHPLIASLWTAARVLRRCSCGRISFERGTAGHTKMDGTLAVAKVALLHDNCVMR